jgi:site-specific DNA recombinase
MAMSTIVPQRAAIYTRISEADPKTEKTEIQEKRLRKLATSEGYSIIDVYEDNGKSAWSGKTRPAFLRLVRDIRQDKFDVILAVAEDRLARNSQEKIGLQAECTKYGITWHTLAGGTVDPSTASGGLLSTITGAIAEYESTIKAERVRARIEDRANSGHGSWGTRPFGFEIDRVTPVPEEAEAIRMAYESVIAQVSLYTVAKTLNQRGLKTSRGNEWSYQSVRKLIMNPRNVGRVVHRGEVLKDVDAAWEPLVEESVYEAAVAILTDPKRVTAPGRKPVHLLAGIAQCECGSTMRSGRANIGGGSVLIYRCKASSLPTVNRMKHRAISVETLDRLVTAAMVSAFIFGPRDSTPNREGADLEALRVKLSKARAGQKRFLDLVELGAIELADAASNLTRLKAEEAEASRLIDAEIVENASAGMFMAAQASLLAPGTVNVADVVSARKTLTARFAGLDIDKRKELVKAHLDIVVRGGRKESRVQITHKIVTSLNDD